MRVLHLASFSGNQGDVINHLGFKNWFSHYLNIEPEWYEVEIRQIYRKEITFQEKVIDVANDYDLVVVGGGNYFETWPTNTWSGTSIDLNPDSFAGVKAPFFFNSLGVDSGQGVSKEAQSNFRTMFLSLMERQKNLLTVRNDGSLNTLNCLTGISEKSNLFSIPDGGFFIDKISKTTNEKTLVINVAADMEKIRYKTESGGLNNFIQLMAQYVNEMHQINDFDQIIFTQHVIGDLPLITSIISLIDERIKRHTIAVSSYGMNLRNTEELIKIYSNASLILGQRFHANVVGLTLRRPTIGLNTYPQILKLYEELDSAQYCAKLENRSDLTELIELSNHAISNPDGFMKNLNVELDRMYENTIVKHSNIAKWIRSNLG
jgi:polysaccharide pyruvyl transferase WcaK-like protein